MGSQRKATPWNLALFGVVIFMQTLVTVSQLPPMPMPSFFELQKQYNEETIRAIHGEAAVNVHVVHSPSIAHPYNIISSPHERGVLYVAAFDLNRIVRFKLRNERGEDRASYKVFAAPESLDGPVGMVFTPEGDLMVSSFGTDLIMRFNSTGYLVHSFGNEEQLDCPQGMTIGSDNLLYVTSLLLNRVVRYTLDGEYLGVFISGSELQSPEDVLFLPDGSVAVSSYDNNKILRYSQEGRYLGVFAEDHTLRGPTHMRMGPDRLLYISSYLRDRVVRFDPFTGTPVDYSVTNSLKGPTGITFGADRVMYVTSFPNDVIVRFNTTSPLYWRAAAGPGSVAAAGSNYY